jgi:ATP-dependent Clp protease adaptor protein ClpS
MADSPQSPQSAPTPPPDLPPDLEAEAQPNQPATGVTTKPLPAKPVPKVLPPWKVLLHNDDVNEILFVVETVMLLTHLKKQEAITRTLEAHHRGVTLLLTTHRERAELYVQQFASRNLTVTIEPDQG